MEMQLLIPIIIQRFVLRPAPDCVIGKNPQITLSPLYGLPMIVHTRERLRETAGNPPTNSSITT
jgi:hypothetical protein